MTNNTDKCIRRLNLASCSLSEERNQPTPSRRRRRRKKIRDEQEQLRRLAIDLRYVLGLRESQHRNELGEVVFVASSDKLTCARQTITDQDVQILNLTDELKIATRSDSSYEFSEVHH